MNDLHHTDRILVITNTRKYGNNQCQKLILRSISFDRLQKLIIGGIVSAFSREELSQAPLSGNMSKNGKHPVSSGSRYQFFFLADPANRIISSG